MKTIVVQCPGCRFTDSAPAACLLLEVGSPDEERDGSSASWICGACQTLVTLPVDLAMFISLVAAGAQVVDSALTSDEGGAGR